MKTNVSRLVLVLTLLAPAASAQLATDGPSFAELRRPMPATPWSRALALGDWDQDGDVDAVVSTFPGLFFQSEIRLLTNDGNGRLEIAQTYVGFADVVSAALGDLNGDGLLDALLGSAFGAPLTLINDGAGGGSIATLDTSLATYGREVALSDLNGNGRLDAVLISNGGVYVLAGNGDGTFAFEPDHYPEASSANEVVARDLDGDGDVDLVVVGSGVFFLYNDGTGAFTVEAEPSQYSTFWLDVADVDGDGDADVVYQDFALKLRLNDGSGNFVEAPDQLPDDVPFGSYLLLRDFDRDGDADLLLGGAFLRNDGSGVFTIADEIDALPPVTRTWFIEAADMDGDDDLDVVAVGPDRVLFGDATGSFFDPIRAEGTTSFFGPPAVGDVDGDGDPDVVTRGDGWELRRNDGRGVFELDVDAIPPLGGFRPTLEDIDADGDLDLFAGFPNAFALNDGTGTFTAADGACTPTTVTAILDTVLADFDGDGDLDAFLGRAAPRGPSYEGSGYLPALDGLWMNEGGACYVDATDQLPALGATTYGVVGGDIDRDGDVDVVTSAGQAYRNDGTGTFEEIPIPFELNGRDVALGDLDGDGDLDAYVASRFGDRILWNDGTGNFPTDAAGAGQGWNVGLADLDADGDLDVVLGVWRAGGGFGNFIVFMEAYRTDAPGQFTQLAFPSSAEREFALADLDGDQDVDVLNPRRTFMNQTRSMSQASVAGPGRPLDIALSGRPGAYWRLFAATSLAEPTTSVFGTSLLDESTIFLGRHGRFDATGRTTARFRVPDEPALIGSTVFWQALIGAPPRWSSYEKTTFTPY